MNQYELALILNSTLSDSELQKLSTELRNMLTQAGATEIDPNRSERRILAYPIRKQKEAIYLYIKFTGPASIPARIQTELKHRDEILRLRFMRTSPIAPLSAPCEEPPTSTSTAESTNG